MQIDNVFKSELTCDQVKKDSRVKKQIKIDNCNWNLHIWTPPLENGGISYAVCCTSKAYPERIIYKYLKELNDLTSKIETINDVGDLRTNILNSIKDFKRNVKDITIKFDDYKKFDKVFELENEVEEIKATVKDNVNIIFQNKVGFVFVNFKRLLTN